MEIIENHFGELEGKTVHSYTLINDEGMQVTCLDYGCIITKIITPDREGSFEDVVLGFDDIEDYLEHSPYFGAVVGRVAGRIKKAQFTLDDKTYYLAKNDKGNHLHGGIKGFDKVVWDTETTRTADTASIEFSYLSNDGEEGYPGNLQMRVKYTLNNENELIISYYGVTDQDTLLNVTNHSYFNLSGNLKRDILNHELTLKSSRFVELDEELIPTGEIVSVDGTVFDFRNGRKIKDGTTSENEQNILAGKGYDHPFLLEEHHNQEIVLFDEESGRELTIETDQPGVVLYAGTQLTDIFSMRGVKSRAYLGICLETQGLPDSIHHPHFPSCILEKGEEFNSKTVYRFGVR